MKKNIRKRNLFLSLLFVLLACTFFAFMPTHAKAFADQAGSTEKITITFDARGGTILPEITTYEIDKGGSLSSVLAEMPTAKKNYNFFGGWYYIQTDTSGNPIHSKPELSTTFNENTTIYADWNEKINKYTISKSAENYTIVGETTNSNAKYNLSTSETSIENAITKILNDLNSGIEECTIIFNDISLENNLELSYKNLTLSGNLLLNQYSITYTSLETSSKLTLTDLTITSDGNQNQVNLQGDYAASLVSKNTFFLSNSPNKNYAIFLTNTNFSLSFSEKIKHTTSYLFNHISQNTINTACFQNDIDFSEQENNQISITVPYTSDSITIVKIINDSTLNNNKKENYRFVPLSDAYTCEISSSGTSLRCQVYFNINFEPNGGEPSGTVTHTNTRYKENMMINYKSYIEGAEADETDDKYKIAHKSISGFIAKITLDETTRIANSLESNVWYIDANEFMNFKEANASISDFSTYFTTTPEKTTFRPFNYYLYESVNISPDFYIVGYFLSLGLEPTFVTCWTDKIYTINFVENGGSTCEPVSAAYGTLISLPSPSKEGYTFLGWFNQDDTAVSINTMPDTNPTYYAKWEINNYNLTIDRKNGELAINTVVQYGSNLLEIADLNSSLFTKTGYEFVGWFIDNTTTQIDETTTMPATNLSIHAQWQIKQYTITLYLNKTSDDNTIFKTITADYLSEISDLFSTNPSELGKEFKGWFTSRNGYDNGDQTITSLSSMPAQNTNLYAGWKNINYTITFFYNSNTVWSRLTLHYGDEITTPTINLSGFIFNGWYNEITLETPFNTQSMPLHDVNAYAKITEKQTIDIDIIAQSNEKSRINGFTLNTPLNNFKIEYLVNGEWTTTIPDKVGTYDVKITRHEDASFKSFSKVLENGFTISGNKVSLKIYSIILYCVAVIEIIFSVIVLMLKKQRASYLNFAIAFPFGVVGTGDFISFLISLILAIFGFVLLIIQIVGLHRTNNQIQLTKDKDNKYTPPDVSKNETIKKNVDIILKNNGFETAAQELKDDSSNSKIDMLDENENDNKNNKDDLTDKNN